MRMCDIFYTWIFISEDLQSGQQSLTVPIYKLILLVLKNKWLVDLIFDLRTRIKYFISFTKIPVVIKETLKI